MSHLKLKTLAWTLIKRHSVESELERSKPASTVYAKPGPFSGEQAAFDHG